jgi:hypothetical protein
MHDALRAQLDDEEREERLEEQVMDLEEVAGPDLLGMVPEEGGSGLAARTVRMRLTHISFDGPLRDLDIELRPVTFDAYSLTRTGQRRRTSAAQTND